MKRQATGDIQYSEDELIRHLMTSPEANLCHTAIDFDVPNVLNSLLEDDVILRHSDELNTSPDQIDADNQKQWFMPPHYKMMDIAAYIIGLCKTDVELQRVGQELMLYQERDLFDLLRYMKYLVDTMRENGIIWGVGRGSSVASYVLFLLGVHRVDSIFYDLAIEEFLR